MPKVELRLGCLRNLSSHLWNYMLCICNDTLSKPSSWDASPTIPLFHLFIIIFYILCRITRPPLDFIIVTTCEQFFPVGESLNFWVQTTLGVASKFKSSWSFESLGPSAILSSDDFRNNVFYCIEFKTRFVFWISVIFAYLLWVCGNC